MERDVRTDAPAVVNTEPRYVPLSLPSNASRRERQAFARLCALLSEVDVRTTGSGLDHDDYARRAGLGNLYEQPILAAAAHTLIDLADQGWTLAIDKAGPLLRLPSVDGNPDLEKARVQRQEHVRR